MGLANIKEKVLSPVLRLWSPRELQVTTTAKNHWPKLYTGSIRLQFANLTVKLLGRDDKGPFDLSETISQF